MKAQILHDINQIIFEETDIPQISNDEVLIKVKAAGICGSDIPRIYQTGAHRHPLIPGHEFSGEVVELGSNVCKEWLNKRVGIFPLIPCRECIPCKKKLYEMCRSYSYLGSRRDGGFAEYVAVPGWNLIELPEMVSYEQAAMLEPTAVAAHAMRAVLGSNKNDYPDRKTTIAVCGLGTIGLLLTMLLKEAGYENILCIGNKTSQKLAIDKLGISADYYCNSKQQNISDWILEKTNQNGVEIYFECVGKNETVAQAVDLCSPAGKVMLVGNPYTDMNFDKQTYWKILRNQLTVKGTWNSSYTNDSNDDWHYVLNLLGEQRINPELFISHRFSLEDLQQGLEIMRDKTEDYIKIMCVNTIS